MKTLKDYLSPALAIFAMQSEDIVTASDPETSNSNDTTFGDVYY